MGHSRRPGVYYTVLDNNRDIAYRLMAYWRHVALFEFDQTIRAIYIGAVAPLTSTHIREP